MTCKRSLIYYPPSISPCLSSVAVYMFIAMNAGGPLKNNEWARPKIGWLFVVVGTK